MSPKTGISIVLLSWLSLLGARSASAADGAQYVSAQVPSTISPGQQVAVSVTMTNTGTTTWTAAGQYKLGSQNPQDNLVWGVGRVTLGSSESIVHGQQKTFSFTITAPLTGGAYNFQWRMLVEGVAWFGDLTPNFVIQVTTAGCVQQDLSAYFVPSYSGWSTATRHWLGSDGTRNTERWLSYAPNKYSHIKFSDSQSSETFSIDADWIYITAENKINDTSQSRVWPPGTYGLGLRWLPRYALSGSCSNFFDPCDSAENVYSNCTLTQTNGGSYCATYGSTVRFATVTYRAGTFQSIIKSDILDNQWVENYYYGLGRGLLRFEQFDSTGKLIISAEQIGEDQIQSLTDQACFHP